MLGSAERWFEAKGFAQMMDGMMVALNRGLGDGKRTFWLDQELARRM